MRAGTSEEIRVGAPVADSASGPLSSLLLNEMPDRLRSAASETTPATATAFPHFPNVTAMRGLAICGVVWIHLVARTPWQRWNGLGRFGAEFFVAIAAFFLVFRSGPIRRRPFIGFCRDRFGTLILPFIAWLAFYALLVPLAGRRIVDHLWFLPFLFAGLVCLWPLTLLPMARLWVRLAAVIGLALLGITAAVVDPTAIGRVEYAQVETAIGHSWSFVPGLFWGACLGSLLQGRLRQMPPSWPALWVPGLIGGALCIGVLVARGPSMNPVLRNLAAVGAVAIAVGSSSNTFTRSLDRLGGAAYGVYLVHPGVLFVFSCILRWIRIDLSLHFLLLEGTFAVACSFAITRLLQAWPRVAWLVPGDSGKRAASVQVRL